LTYDIPKYSGWQGELKSPTKSVVANTRFRGNCKKPRKCAKNKNGHIIYQNLRNCNWNPNNMLKIAKTKIFALFLQIRKFFAIIEKSRKLIFSEINNCKFSSGELQLSGVELRMCGTKCHYEQCNGRELQFAAVLGCPVSRRFHHKNCENMLKIAQAKIVIAVTYSQFH
jgi:hypothetical protein